ncbi:MAG: MBL fold metallo-hydrolase [Saprospiraceae bacterium]
MATPIRIELPTQFGMQSVNAYLMLGDEPTLIDCGENTDAVWQTLTSALAKYNLKVSDLSRVIITHAHVDHIGMAGRIIANSEAELWISEYGVDWAIDPINMNERRIKIAQSYFGELGEAPTGSFIHQFVTMFRSLRNYWTAIPAERVRTFAVDDVLNINGEEWKSIYAPGHCVHQTCFYHASSKTLISADMILPLAPAPVIDPALDAPYGRVKALPMLLESYQRFQQLEVKAVFSGHYEPINNYYELIDRQVNRIHQRVEESHQAIATGTNQFWDLLEKIYAGRVGFMAVPMLMGYLDILEIDNRIQKEKVNGILQYTTI